MNGLRFRAFILSLISSVNSQTKASKVRDDKLKGGDQFSAAEKCEGRINIVVESGSAELL